MNDQLLIYSLILIDLRFKDHKTVIKSKYIKTDYPCNLKLWLLFFYYHLSIYAKKNVGCDMEHGIPLCMILRLHRYCRPRTTDTAILPRMTSGIAPYLSNDPPVTR